MRPIMTKIDKMKVSQHEYNSQLLNQLDAVDIAAPLLRRDSGKTSVGNTQATGPKLTPYAAVNRYIRLRNYKYKIVVNSGETLT